MLLWPLAGTLIIWLRLLVRFLPIWFPPPALSIVYSLEERICRSVCSPHLRSGSEWLAHF